MIKTVSILLLVLLGVLLLMASRQPDAFAIERSVVVSAPAEVIYPKIADLHQWSAWSPYEKFDPQMKKVFKTLKERQEQMQNQQMQQKQQELEQQQQQAQAQLAQAQQMQQEKQAHDDYQNELDRINRKRLLLLQLNLNQVHCLM